MKSVFALAALALSFPGWAGPPSYSMAARDAEFRRSFVNYLFDKNPQDTDLQNLVYGYAFVDLNDDGRDEALVWFQDSEWCGTGGCPLTVFVERRSRWKPLSTTLVTRPPVKLLPTRTNGWHDIGVRQAGGGIGKPYEGRLRFNGRRYDLGWTAARVPSGVYGREIINDAAIALFPTKCRRAVKTSSVFGPLRTKTSRAGTC
jgi:putative lipoprotein